MESSDESLLLRVFLSESDRKDHHPLYEVLVTKAREMNLAGAVVLRGAMGYGASHQIHTTKILDLSAPLPIIVEFVDREEKIRAFLPTLEGLMNGGLATLEKVETIFFSRHEAAS